MISSNTLIKVICHACRKKFFRELRWIKYNKQIGNNHYCSKKCSYITKRTGALVKCDNEKCGKIFYRAKHEILTHNFCSQSCAAVFNNREYPKVVAKLGKCKMCGESFKMSENILYCSVECYFLARKPYTNQELIQAIQEYVKKSKRIPARREMRKFSQRCMSLFGSWNNAIHAAGFEPNRSHDDRMYKRSKTKAADGHICDSIFEALTDNWLTQHKIPHRRDVKYPTTNHVADWAIDGGETFIEYFGLVKDSPRYDRTVRNKKNLCRRHNIKLIEIYPKDLYPKVSLENKLGPIV